MALAPATLDSDFKEDGVSTWGGSIVYKEEADPSQTKAKGSGGGSWHMYAAEMLGGCGITSWQSNSQVVHAVADSPLGPWTRTPGVTLHVWAHCPNGAVSPDGAILLPRLWCTPLKYPVGVNASCKAGVRQCMEDGSGQCCRDGASPCGFRLHRGAEQYVKRLCTACWSCLPGQPLFSLKSTLSSPGPQPPAGFMLRD